MVVLIGLSIFFDSVERLIPSSEIRSVDGLLELLLVNCALPPLLLEEVISNESAV